MSALNDKKISVLIVVKYIVKSRSWPEPDNVTSNSAMVELEYGTLLSSFNIKVLKKRENSLPLCNDKKQT